MTDPKGYVAAETAEIYWRYEVCPHRGAKVLLLTIGDVCVLGQWVGDLNQYFQAWCPMPKKKPAQQGATRTSP